MKVYVGKYEELGLNQEFQVKSKEQLARFAKEIPFSYTFLKSLFFFNDSENFILIFL